MTQVTVDHRSWGGFGAYHRWILASSVPDPEIYAVAAAAPLFGGVQHLLPRSGLDLH